MPVNNQHHEYIAALPDWVAMQQALDGEREVKSDNSNLPMPSGMKEAEKIDQANKYLYTGYKERAQYQQWVADSLRSMMGLVSRQVPEIVLPKAMEGIIDNATDDGFSLQQLYSRVVRQILSKGRAPLVMNIDSNGNPYFSIYQPENAINWKLAQVDGRHDLVLAVFREFREKEDGDEYSHETEEVFRVFHLFDGKVTTKVVNDAGVVIEEEVTLGKVGAANEVIAGLKYLPVIYCGSTNNSPDVDEIPLLTMARAALKDYQLSADYYTSLHYTSHPQPWVSGLDGDTELSVTGPSAAWDLGQNGSCGYLEFQGKGIEAVRKAMQDQKQSALEAGAKVMDLGTESGDARRARQDDQQATLHSVAVTAAEAIEQGLRYLAEWMGENPDDVQFIVKPEFLVPTVDAQIAQELLKAVMAGTVSNDTYWQYITTGRMPERKYEDESAMIDTAAPMLTE